MAKPPLSLSKGASGSDLLAPGWAAGVYFVLTAILGGLIWSGSARIWRLTGGWLALFVLQAALVLVLQSGLARYSVPRTWSFRLAFFFGVGLAATGWLAGGSFRGGLAEGLFLLELILAAFAGSLAATARSYSLWENNSPPSSRLQAEVLRRHQEWMGEPALISIPKRVFDISLSILGLLVSTPVWLITVFLVWLEDPGPVLFVKNSVGRGGINFRQFKFRTMVYQAEQDTGPILAREQDERVLQVGRLLRKTALDELPQLINILKGEMSFVGPRPQRTVLVHDYLERLPEYAERHSVLPGLAGLAQVAGDYYLTPRQKLRLDRLYIRYSGLGFDLKLVFLAFLITFWYRWRKDWNGRLPRRLIRF